MVIAVDAMGGDNAPEAVVAGALRAAPQVPGEVILVGPAERIEALLPPERSRPANLRVVDAPQVIGMGENAGRAARSKPDSSLAVAVNLVRDGVADAAVSAGNSGAFMFLAQVRLRNLPGLQRSAIAVPLPGPSGPRIMLDAGANMDCKPIHLAQFGLMGSVYAEYALGRAEPRVGLLSIGEEPSKGDELTRAAHKLLQAAPINFVGNVEGSDVLTGDCDVIVADGFAGNVVLKVAEGVAKWQYTLVQQEGRRDLRSRLGRLLLQPALRRVLGKLDHANYGGALLLGVQGICIVGHGCSNARAIENAILMAQRAAESNVLQHLSEGLQRLAAAVGTEEQVSTQTA
ncbi:MAG TPA: phosphate acyltransferase PlsX [Armatimonadota bacterium]|jgi:glycerol-3-phosphate acyltransferase PlsX